MNQNKFRPRGVLNQDVAGICGVARMTDKARAAHNGKIGNYYRYGADSKQDTEILSFLGFSADEFQETAVKIDDDVKLGAWILGKCEKSSEEVSEFNNKLKSQVKQITPRSTFSNRRRQLAGDDEPPFPWWMAPGWWTLWKIFKR